MNFDSLNFKNITSPYPIEYIKLLHDIVLDIKPKNIYEFGCSWGSTAIGMASALESLNSGMLYTHDISTERTQHASNLFKKLNLENYIVTKCLDVTTILNSDINNIDMFYIDIDNDGKKLFNVLNSTLILNNPNALILFEGGSNIREQICIDRKVPTFQKFLSYEVLYGEGKRYSFSKFLNYAK